MNDRGADDASHWYRQAAAKTHYQSERGGWGFYLGLNSLRVTCAPPSAVNRSIQYKRREPHPPEPRVARGASGCCCGHTGTSAARPEQRGLRPIAIPPQNTLHLCNATIRTVSDPLTTGQQRKTRFCSINEGFPPSDHKYALRRQITVHDALCRYPQARRCEESVY